ncbi:hypothetical protein ABTZ03_31535 [Kitasatospora sp. NPDC096077]|uniref:hypothetical protein n=1 Tax=Kitasatospora sp. NPDC096077 TaxID=3155544 RepID=UPI0033329862
MKETTRPRAPDVAPLLTVDNSGGCSCPQPARCVLRLELPPVQGQMKDAQGRIWTVLSRRQLADPTTGVINSTRIVLRRVEEVSGKAMPTFLTIRCAGPPSYENEYERRRETRPPRAERLPFEPARPARN